MRPLRPLDQLCRKLVVPKALQMMNRTGMESESVVGAFSEGQASAISGISLAQLRKWRKDGFFDPSFGDDETHVPYGRIYSFRDLVALQVLNDLRNEKKISLSHLREVSDKLAHLGDDRWGKTTLYVLGKRVVFDDPETSERREVVSGQRVFNIPLRVVVRSTRERIQALNERSEVIGQFAKRRFVSGSEQVFAGTRVPVSSVLDFLKAGFDVTAIMREFPVLTDEDIRAAAELLKQRNAA